VLALMRLGAKQVGSIDLTDLILLQIFFEQITQITD
jgi:hypothetical protein